VTGWDDPKVSPPTGLVTGVGVGALLQARRNGTGGLAYRFRERDQVVRTRRRGLELPLVPNHLPTAWRGQVAGVRLAQVVRVRFGESRERTYHGRRLVIDIGQRGDGLSGAAVTGATPW
jgi:hypothetical protein